MQRVNKFGVVLACVCSMGAYAQGTNSTTLSQAIDTAKARKSVELNISAREFGGAPASTSSTTNSKSKTALSPLKLWSIQGVGNSLHAEVLYQGRIHDVSIATNEVRVGNWLLVGLTDEEATFVPSGWGGKNITTSGQMIRLQVPRSSQATSQFFPTQSFGLMSPSTAALSASTIPNDAASALSSISRVPVPFELIKP
jgi:hypothetical protein